MIITSCPKSTIVLTLTAGDSEFYLGPEQHTFTAGNGETVSANIIPPTIKGSGTLSDSLPDNVPSLDYTSSANSFWLQVDVSSGFSSFRFKYTIVPSGRTGELCFAD